MRTGRSLAVFPGGVYLVGGVPGPGGTWSGGVYLVLGGCTWSRGVPGPGGVYLVQGGVPGLGGVPGPRVGGWVYLVWGVCTWSLGGVPGRHPLRDQTRYTPSREQNE